MTFLAPYNTTFPFNLVFQLVRSFLQILILFLEPGHFLILYFHFLLQLFYISLKAFDLSYLQDNLWHSLEKSFIA
jgi:hypothetical protein